MSLSLRLNLIVSILLVGIFVAISLSVLYTTADRLRGEVLSNFEVSKQMVNAKTKLMRSTPIEILQPYPYIDLPFQRSLHMFKLEHFRGIKYISIEILDNDKNLVASNRDGNQFELEIPEKLKMLLLLSYFKGMDTVSQPLSIGDVNIGTVVIKTDTEAELRDLWYETLVTVMPIMVLFMLISITMTFVIAYIIKPIDEFVRAVNYERGVEQEHALSFVHISYIFRLPSYLKGIHHELKDSSQKVHELSTKILDLQEEERRRISAELHDELGQHLTAIRFEAELIRTAENIEDTQQSAEAIDEIGSTMKDIVRSMLERLRPPDLDTLGLKGAISEMISNWQLRHPQAEVQFNYETNFPMLDESKQLSIYRIVQEALTNISRHAGSSADNISVSLSSIDESLSISVSDNGQGCDLSKQVRGFGLIGMRERVDGLSGQLTLISSQGNGMKIFVDIPK